ncbi:MAG TPA: serine/threonine-protein kinase [Gemmataceae bacterium]|nr:serine/threonine-protein kinase [Gemmataceae bacterium]
MLRMIGAGGMGVVFQAEDPQLGRLVALKVMRPGLASDAVVRKRFLREARAMAAIKHDHVLTVYQVGEERGIPFFAAGLLEGESLEDRPRREGHQPAAEVLRVGREMAEGLAAAHERGLVHRDVKPANVWLERPRGRVKVLDFGLARNSRAEANLTQKGTILGTPAYMAPEQAQGRAVDQRTDLFSLGCVLYRACTGRLAFPGDDKIAILLSVSTQDPPPPAQVSRDVPSGLSDLVMRLLAKQPEARPQTAAAVAAALQELERFAKGWRTE